MRLLIADDEPLARQRLHDLIGDLGGHQIVAEAADGRQACDLSAQYLPDVVILDIAMPGMDGLEAARQLREMPSPPVVIFCTAYDEHALAAFDASAVDYVVKPIRAERLAVALARAERFLAAHTATQPTYRMHLSARMRGSLRLIPIEDVRYLQAQEKYVVVHHVHGEDLIEDSLKSLEAEFGDLFIRIHRNCLIARDEIKELIREPNGREFVSLRNDPARLEVSRRCLSHVRQRLKTL